MITGTLLSVSMCTSLAIETVIVLTAQTRRGVRVPLTLTLLVRVGRHGFTVTSRTYVCPAAGDVTAHRTVMTALMKQTVI